MTAQSQVSKLNVLALIGPPASVSAVSKLNVYALTGPTANVTAVSKVNIYALITTTPLIRRKCGVSVNVGRFQIPA